MNILNENTVTDQQLLMGIVVGSVARSIDSVGRDHTMKIMHEIFTKLECISNCTIEQFNDGQFTINEPTIERAEFLFDQLLTELKQQKVA